MAAQKNVKNIMPQKAFSGGTLLEGEHGRAGFMKDLCGLSKGC